MNYEKSCGTVLFNDEDRKIRYLVVRSKDGNYGFPKGHIEDGETEKETAMREIYEELKIKPTIIDGFKESTEYELTDKKDTIKRVTYFLAKYSNQKIIRKEDELSEASLYTYEEAMKLIKFDNLKEILKRANQRLNQYILNFDSKTS